jgi:hypothetical protein
VHAQRPWLIGSLVRRDPPSLRPHAKRRGFRISLEIRYDRIYEPYAVAAVGMALMGGGALLLTQVSVGDYFGDIFFGLLVFGPGVGLAFVTASIAALAGVPERESGLASGLSNTSFQIGAALGVAIVTTVAVTRTDDYLTANAGANRLVALTEGFQSAFLAVAILAGIGVALALLLLGRPRGIPQEQLEPSAVPAGD